jgi:hypothetical protein
MTTENPKTVYVVIQGETSGQRNPMGCFNSQEEAIGSVARWIDRHRSPFSDWKKSSKTSWKSKSGFIEVRREKVWTLDDEC